MADAVKSYFLAPRFDWGADGPVRLGNIVANPSTPHEPKNIELFPLPTIHESEYLNWKDEKTRRLNGTMGIWAQFLQFLGLGGEVSIDFGESKKDVHQFDKLVTRYIIPEDAYIEERMQDQKVHDFLEEHKFKKRVYLITGIKIACKPVASTVVTKEFGTHGKLGADFTSLGAAVSVGPKVDTSSGKTSSTSFQGGSDFVFAYQLREIFYKKVRNKVSLQSREVVKGAMYGLDDKKYMKTQDEERVVETLEVLGWSKSDLRGESVGMKPILVLDDDGTAPCECVIPEANEQS
jgi:hypothetical protein